MPAPLPQIGDWTSFEELGRIQSKQLDTVLERAMRSPFYRERLAGRQPSALADLGVTRKDDLRAGYPFGMLAVERRELATYHESSGSSGVPTPSYYTAAEWTDLTDRFARKSVPMTADDTLLVRIPYALVLAGHLAHQAALATGATVVAGDCRSLAAPYSRIVRALHDLDVSLTWSTPSDTLVWAAGAQLAGYRPAEDFPALRALYVGGEPLGPVRRERIAAIWGVPVVEEYGCTEIGSLAGTCPQGRMHLWADRVLAEVRDPATGEISAEGVGQLVLTPLFREAMPLLRYDLEDLVELRSQDCPCGWYLPTIRVLGRAGSDIPVAGGSVTSRQVEDAVFGLPAEYGVMFWRARAGADALTVQIEAAPPFAADARAALAAHAPEALGVPVRVETVPVGTLVPLELLSNRLDAMKPRRLFAADEDWDAAVLTC